MVMHKKNDFPDEFDLLFIFHSKFGKKNLNIVKFNQRLKFLS
jgi:hypothetical protein